jgi:hypothetical protein
VVVIQLQMPLSAYSAGASAGAASVAISSVSFT